MVKTKGRQGLSALSGLASLGKDLEEKVVQSKPNKTLAETNEIENEEKVDNEPEDTTYVPENSPKNLQGKSAVESNEEKTIALKNQLTTNVVIMRDHHEILKLHAILEHKSMLQVMYEITEDYINRNGLKKLMNYAKASRSKRK